MKKLDIGCGGNKNEGFIGIDFRELPGVDVVHDLEKFPWPLFDEEFDSAVAGHLIEHIKPWLSIYFMNEVWRVLKEGGTFAASTPYAGSKGYWQDPTHCNGWSEITFQYFDPAYPLYYIYKPKPWHVLKGFPVWQANGNLEVIMEKVIDAEAYVLKAQKEGEKVADLGISVAEQVKSREAMK